MRQLYRSRHDKVMGGVCGGLGRYLGIDPLIVRILFVILALSEGVGLALYVLLWIFVPLEPETTAAQGDRDADLVDPFEEKPAGEVKAQDRMILVGVLLIGFGLFTLLRNFVPIPWIGKLWPLALVALGVLLLISNLRESA